MAVYFQLRRKTDNEIVMQQDVDNEMREALGEPADPKEWLFGWYDSIGLLMACGKDWDDLYSTFDEDTNKVRVLDYLKEYYNIDCGWCK